MGLPLVELLGRRRVLADVAAWVFAVAMAAVCAAFSGANALRPALLVCVVAAGAQVVVGLLSGLYRGRARVASFEEVAWLSLTTLCAGVAASLATLLLARPALGVALSAIATPLALLGAL